MYILQACLYGRQDKFPPKFMATYITDTPEFSNMDILCEKVSLLLFSVS